jgi:hypothetical protein
MCGEEGIDMIHEQHSKGRRLLDTVDTVDPRSLRALQLTIITRTRI